MLNAILFVYHKATSFVLLYYLPVYLLSALIYIKEFRVRVDMAPMTIRIILNPDMLPLPVWEGMTVSNLGP